MHIVCSRCMAEYDLDDDKLIVKRLFACCPKCKNTFWVEGQGTSAGDTPEDGPAPAEAGSSAAQRSDEPFPAAMRQDAGLPPFDEAVPSSDAGSETIGTDRSRDLPGKHVTKEMPETTLVELRHFIDSLPSGMAYGGPPRSGHHKGGRELARKILPVVVIGAVVAAFLIPQIRKPFAAAITDTSRTFRESLYPSNPLAIEKVRSRFVQDNLDSALFVVEGQVRNRSEDPVVYPMMIGKLLNKDGEVIQQSKTCSGRRLRTEELRTFGAAKIGEIFELLPGGEEPSKVQPGYSVPFMVVFDSPPDGAEEFEIEVLENVVSDS